MVKNKLSFIICSAAFLAWGILPLYWQLMFYMPPEEVVAYRVSSSFVFIVILTTFTRRWRETLSVLKSKKDLLVLFSAGLLVGSNWLIYIQALEAKEAFQVSTGYYITPLLNALIGYVVFKEGIRPLQLIALTLAFIGVSSFMIAQNKIPYYALLVSITFAIYGAVHRFTKVNVLDGMNYEMFILFIPAIIYISNFSPSLPIYQKSISQIMIIFMAGSLTVMPLAGFSYGIKHLKFMTVGILQYLSPTATLILGIFYYKEKITASVIMLFSFIWLGIIIYILDAYIQNKKQKLFYKKNNF